MGPHAHAPRGVPRRPAGPLLPPSPASGQSVPLFLPCAAGVEPLLADECAAILGIDRSVLPADPQARAVVERRGGVQVRGDALAAMRLNLHSRLAQRVLWPLAHGGYEDEHALYALARQVDWPAWITPAQTLRIDTSARQSPLHSLNFATLRVKDAVCDVLREATGARPSVDTRHPDLPLLLHLDAETATLYADTSGEALFKRGWRNERDGGLKGEAPLKETLAAAMLAAAGWAGRAADGPLLDPCCGAGTIVIEAAQIACGIAPGLSRRFAFERLRPFAALLPQWQALRQAAREAQHAPGAAIFAGDVSFRMTDFASRNAQAAGVAHAIAFKAGDALQRPPPAAAGTLVMNPPYGERIAAKGAHGVPDAQGARGRAGAQGREAFVDAGGADGAHGGGGESGDGGAQAAAFFSRLAAHWKRQYAGWTAWVLSPDMRLPQALRLKESRRQPMWNGPIECRLFRFDLVAGSARAEPGAPAAPPGTTGLG